jgi:hypothetical protein
MPVTPAQPKKRDVHWIVAIVLALALLGIATAAPALGIGLALVLIVLDIAVLANRFSRTAFGYLLLPDPTRPSVVGIAVLELGLALFVVITAIGARSAASARMEQERVSEVRRAAAAAQEARARELEVQRLTREATAAAREIGSTITSAQAEIDRGNFERAGEILRQASERRAPFLVLRPLPEDVARASTALDTNVQFVECVLGGRRSVEEARRLLAEGTQQARDRDYLAADGSLRGALAALDGIGAECRQEVNASDVRPTIERQQLRIEAPLRRAQALHEKEEAYAALCGPRVQPSEWDGAIIGFETAVERTAHDPDSIDVENCAVPQLTRGDCWVSECSVRGRNAFGAMVLNRIRFFFRSVDGIAQVLSTETL